MGAAPEHYRCYQIYISKTRGTRICDTVEFFPTHCKLPSVSSHDAVIYAANDLITVLTKPQPKNSVISIGDDQLVALRKLATIFQCSIQQKLIADPGEQDITPPQRPHTCSQTKALANAAIRAPSGPTVRHTHPQPLDDPKHDEELAPNHLCDVQHHDIPLIMPIIKNLRPQFPAKHEGMLEDLFPLIRAANAVTDPHTGKQLEHKQLINHPNQELHQTWQCSSANEFG